MIIEDFQTEHTKYMLMEITYWMQSRGLPDFWLCSWSLWPCTTTSTHPTHLMINRGGMLEMTRQVIVLVEQQRLCVGDIQQSKYRQRIPLLVNIIDIESKRNHHYQWIRWLSLYSGSCSLCLDISKMYVTASMLDFLEKVEAINYDEKDRIFSKLRLSL